MPLRRVAAALAVFAAGFALGGYLFSETRARDVLPFKPCEERCYKAQEVAGLIASVAILRASALVPAVVLESDNCLAVRHPRPEARIHYVLFPKHDTRNIATLSADDAPYVMACFAMVRELVVRDRLQSYRVLTNGPALQDVAYLHFHLIGR
jgi:hypothetical protein